MGRPDRSRHARAAWRSPRSRGQRTGQSPADAERGTDQPTTTVYEIRGAAETSTAPGDGLLRYWVDRSGLLRRVEVRTGDRAYGYLDVSAGPVPVLSPPR